MSALQIPFRNIRSARLIKYPRHTKNNCKEKELSLYEAQMILMRSLSISCWPHMAELTTQRSVTPRSHAVLRPLLSLLHCLLLFCPSFSLFLENLWSSGLQSFSSETPQTCGALAIYQFLIFCTWGRATLHIRLASVQKLNICTQVPHKICGGGETVFIYPR